MKIFPIVSLAPLLWLASTHSQEGMVSSEDEEPFVYNVGEVNYLTGEGVNAGGILHPSLYFTAAGGAFEPGTGAGDVSTAEHDPQNEVGVQGIAIHFDLNVNEVVTGMIAGFGHQGEDHVWEAGLEEAYLHWNATELLSIGGGMFFNTFGFQSNLHLHDWSFVNQNLTNSRIINEGELITQGGEILVRTPAHGLLTLGFGGVRTHGGEHGQHGGEEEEHEEDEDEHGDEHLEADEAGFQNWVLTADYRFRLPVDDSITASLSLALGENGFGRNSSLYGAGVRKVWNGSDHGNGGPDFCSGALMFQSEIIGRNVDAFLEDGDAASFSDHGFSNSLHYGVSDAATVSFRHDWVSAVELADLSDRHRLSAALTAFVDPEQRVRARIQYDYTQDDTIGSEHAAWFQIQLQWGGIAGSHADHGH